MVVTIYHNPQCSKSRATLTLLNEKGIEPVVVEYLKTPPSTQEIAQILKLLDLSPRQLLRTQEEEFVDAGLDNLDLSDKQVIEALHQYPKLMERPIVVVDEDRAVIGRPPENINQIL